MVHVILILIIASQAAHVHVAPSQLWRRPASLLIHVINFIVLVRVILHNTCRSSSRLYLDRGRCIHQGREFGTRGCVLVLGVALATSALLRSLGVVLGGRVWPSTGMRHGHGVAHDHLEALAVSVGALLGPIYILGTLSGQMVAWKAA